MLNKFNAALIATIVYGVLFPLAYHCITQEHVQPLAVAGSAVLFFFLMVAAFGKLLHRRTGQAS